MDFLRPMTVRHVLAVATAGVAVAAFGGACAAQDDRGAMSQDGYRGAYLSWSGKRAPAPAQPSPDLSEARYAPAPNYAPSSYAPQAPRGAPPPSDAPELTDAPADFAAPPSHAAPPPSAERYSAAAYAPPPAPEPAAAPAPPPATGYVQASSAAPSTQAAQGTSSVRFYSLHRAYGMTPDPIPEPTQGHTVLIGPPDHSAAAQDQGGDNDQDGAGDDGKPAAHGDASGDGQSGDN